MLVADILKALAGLSNPEAQQPSPRPLALSKLVVLNLWVVTALELNDTFTRVTYPAHQIFTLRFEPVAKLQL